MCTQFFCPQHATFQLSLARDLFADYSFRYGYGAPHMLPQSTWPACIALYSGSHDRSSAFLLRHAWFFIVGTRSSFVYEDLQCKFRCSIYFAIIVKHYTSVMLQPLLVLSLLLWFPCLFVAVRNVTCRSSFELSLQTIV